MVWEISPMTHGSVTPIAMLFSVISAVTAYTPTARLTAAPLFQRAASPQMGGFEQRFFSKEGARLSLLVSDAPSLSLADVPSACASEGLSGIVYGLSGDRVEIVAEGGREALEQMAAAVQTAAGGKATLREAWQAPVGGYTASFPIVELAPKMSAKVTMRADPGMLDYMSRHFQIEVHSRTSTADKRFCSACQSLPISLHVSLDFSGKNAAVTETPAHALDPLPAPPQAVFNRGLKLKKTRTQPEEFVLECAGDSGRLKSFVRWCYNGPQLARPDQVTVDWNGA